MIKTPLPEKIKDTAPEGTTFTSLDSTERKINQLITYLAGLTEVVERKQDKHKEVLGTFEIKGTVTKTPTLKEQLLGEIASMEKEEPNEMIDCLIASGYNQALAEVEDVIRRLVK